MAIATENTGATLPAGRSTSHGQSSVDEVANPCGDYKVMQSRFWSLIQSLLGGTDAMRSADTMWTPRNEKEEDIDYKARLDRSFLYGAYADTVDSLVNKPFGKPIVLEDKEKLDEKLCSVAENVDGNGTSLDALSKGLFEDGVNYGLFHILVDYPTKSEDIVTKADEMKANLHPKFIRISPSDLIGWRSESDKLGNTVLSQIRLKETTEEADGDYNTKMVTRIRVINRDTWELWKKIENDSKRASEYILENSGANELGIVPLVTRYFDATGFMTATPPLMDLAWANLEHWQSSSEQRHILHYARVPVLFGAGFTQEEVNSQISVGATSMLNSESPDAKLAYVEISGEAINAGANDLKQIEERMEVLGLQPLVKNSAGSTATRAVINENNNDAEIYQWIRELECGLQESYLLASQWIDKELNEDFSIHIYRDFSISVGASSDMDHLQKMRERKDITQETFLRESIRRGIMNENVDVDVEIEKTRAESAEELSAFVKASDAGGEE